MLVIPANSFACPRIAPIFAWMMPPTTPTSMPTVAAVNAMDCTSGCPASANTVPIAAAEPKPPAQPANSMSPMLSGAPRSGPSSRSTRTSPTTTWSEYMSTPYAAKPATLRPILRMLKSSVSARHANTMTMSSEPYVPN